VANPIVISRHQVEKQAEEEIQHGQHELQLVAQEEANYQHAVANSLGIPYTTPVPPAPFTPTSGSRTVCTIPYRPLKITQHLNDVWMLPAQDSTTKARKIPVLRKGNLDNHFTIIFWGKVRYTVLIYHMTFIDIYFRMIIPRLFALFMNVLNGQNGFSLMRLMSRRISLL